MIFLTPYHFHNRAIGAILSSVESGKGCKSF
ncbi:MAG: hypothetical protein JWL82_86 [Parcubacteria group bacterium]|nr:hypothetical protein [Parcubacteria group bacterium]